ncbi:hypothetical protein [Flavobacterium sp. W22_SRS_FP1]|uniref:hypothetical protein n=1 Tax=Flavobacterium sp. W22_SRS_FP1 TaxID=3240276 RepID=UPI003F8E2C50
MKKKLEADLISIAHRILKIKNKSDVNQLFFETQKLYEKLSVLRFIEENYGLIKPTIGHAEMQKEIEDFYDRTEELPAETVIEMTESKVFPEVAEEQTHNETHPVDEDEAPESLDHEEAPAAEIVTEADSSVDEEKEAPENEEDEEVVEEFQADIQELQLEPEESNHEETSPEETGENLFPEEETPPPFKAAFELTEDSETEITKLAETVQISFSDLLGGNYSEPHFVKVDDIEALPPITLFKAVHDIPESEKAQINTEINPPEIEQAKNVSLNDKLSKGIDIDLNDRIAFVKHLFGNSNEDYNRVLNQLITFDNFYETKNFIEEMVKPDYNDWKGKDDYAERFMDIIEKKFL